MTQQELEQLLQKWQPRLRLSDWNIKACFAALNQMEPHEEAHVVYDVFHSTAQIKVLNPDHVALAPSRLHEFDPEFSLVHELVHLRLADAATLENDDSDPHEERAVNAITHALVNLDRERHALVDEIIELSAHKCKKK